MRNGRRMVVRRIWAPQGDSCREHSQCRACSSEAQPAGKATAGSDPEQLPKHSQASCSLAATRPQTNPDINPRAAALTPKAQRGQLCILGILPACLPGGLQQPPPLLPLLTGTASSTGSSPDAAGTGSRNWGCREPGHIWLSVPADWILWLLFMAEPVNSHSECTPLSHLGRSGFSLKPLLTNPCLRGQEEAVH